MRVSVSNKILPQTHPVAAITAAAALALAAEAAVAQSYPNKPVRILTAEPGGSGDFAARLIAQELGASLGWQVVVVNYSTGVVPGDIVSKSAPDGYTLLVVGNALWIGPLIRSKEN